MLDKVLKQVEHSGSKLSNFSLPVYIILKQRDITMKSYKKKLKNVFI